MSFVRRYGYVPGVEVITQIEGVIVVDLPPPGAINGANTNIAALVGEFPDMTYATSVDGSGVVTTLCRPQEVFSPQDMLDKFGGFDETLGDFGLNDGNGFVALRNKRFSRLVIAPVNLASPQGCRYFRALPLCTAATNALPVVPNQGAVVAAGREFRGASGGRVRTGARVIFTALGVIAAGTGGATTNAGAPAVTQALTVAGQNFYTMSRPDGSTGIKKGDIVVIGNNNAGALQPLPSGGNLGAGTYRVASDALTGSPTVLSLERLDGQTFDLVTAATIPWRIHVSSDADSAPVVVLGQSVPGGYDNNDPGGFSVPSRPLTDEAGAYADGSWTAGAVLTPASVPPAITGDTWDPLTGLAGRVHATVAMVHDTDVQKPNAVNHALLDALYGTAYDALLSEAEPISSIGIVWAARTSSTIRTKQKSHALAALARLHGRMCLIRPPLSTQTTSAAVSDSDPGVGANRAETVVYNWPGVRTSVPEAVEFRLKTADGLTTIDGILDVGSDGWMASILSNLAPERNPAQTAEPVPTVMAPVIGLQRGAPSLELNDYIVLRERGVAAPKMDRTSGPIFQSGITTSLTSGQKNISRRRMSFFIEDSLADGLKPFAKLPLTASNKDSEAGIITDFLDTLLSPGNEAAQRIDAYQVDDKSGNTPSMASKGINVIITRVRLTPNGDFIVLQCEIGESVVIQPAA